MSPSTAGVEYLASGVPRASGDEPVIMGWRGELELCSPRERG